MTDNAVELNGVTKRFGRQAAVDGLDLAVPAGSIYGFIGPNGSGKTTTMRMILRIYQPDAGEVRVLGDADRLSADPRVGYLPEERGLYRRMTVQAVLRYFAKLKGVAHPDALIDDHLERVGGSDWKKKRIEQLSKGMAQKIQFIVAVLAEPDLVILDEPFSGLDPVSLNLMRDLVLELHRGGTTVIFSTHDMEVAQGLCEHVFMIYQGRKVLDGPLDSIRQSHGEARLRVRMGGGAPPPDDLPNVTSAHQSDGFTELTLRSDNDRAAVLSRLVAAGDVEHFETMRPKLHDIFVRLAQPTDASDDAPSQPRTADAL